MLALLGKSGSGKTTIENELIKKHGFKRAISHTSRPKRVSDVEGVNYFFVSREEIEKLYADGELVERIDYMDEVYGYVKEQCKDDRTAAVVPDGLRQLLEHKDLNVFSIYFDTSSEVRKERMINRGDSPEMIEKRLSGDDEVFDGVENMVSMVLNNDNKTIDEIVNEVLMMYHSHNMLKEK